MRYHRLISLLLTCSLLSSCVAAVIAGAAAGMIVYDRRAISTLENDARIFHVIHTRLIKDSAFSNSRIAVVSFNRVVLLVGQTPSIDLRNIAEQVARDTPQVTRVYNHISIGPALSISLRGKDTFLTGELRTQMLNTRGLESGSIRIVTEDSVVYLMGIVTPEQADMAVQVARQTRGVRKVFKAFQYIT